MTDELQLALMLQDYVGYETARSIADSWSVILRVFGGSVIVVMAIAGMRGRVGNMRLTVEYKCPKCDRVLHNDTVTDIPLGPEVATCPKCNTRIRTSRMEWNGLNDLGRRRFMLQTGMFAYGLGGFLGGLIGAGLGALLLDGSLFVMSVSALFAVAGIALFAWLLMLKPILESKRRVGQHRPTG